MEWQPIETAINDEVVRAGGNVIVIVPYKDGYLYYIAHYTPEIDSGGYWDDGDEVIDNPTHWMHLPKPPTM